MSANKDTTTSWNDLKLPEKELSDDEVREVLGAESFEQVTQMIMDDYVNGSLKPRDPKDSKSIYLDKVALSTYESLAKAKCQQEQRKIEPSYSNGFGSTIKSAPQNTNGHSASIEQNSTCKSR